MPLATSTANMAALTIKAIHRTRRYPGSTGGADGGQHEADIGDLRDQFVGKKQQGLRDLQSHGTRGLEVDDEVIAQGLLHQKVGRPGAAQDAVDAVGRTPK